MNDLQQIETIARSVNAKVIAKAKMGLIMDVFQLLSSLRNEGLFKVTDDGLSCVVVDPAHIAMMEIVLRKNLFHSLTAEKDCEFGVDFEAVWDLLRNIYADDTQEYLRFKSTEALFIVEETPNSTLHLWTERKHMRWILPDHAGLSQPKIPSLSDESFKAVLTVRAGELRDAVRITTELEDHVTFTFDGELNISASSDTEEITTTVDAVWKERTENARSLLPTEYALDPLKCLDKNTLVKLRIGNAFPIIFEWPIHPESVAGAFDTGSYSARLFVAPRIENAE